MVHHTKNRQYQICHINDIRNVNSIGNITTDTIDFILYQIPHYLILYSRVDIDHYLNIGPTN